MANYGIKVSRAGYDVKTCSDHQMLFSSSFETLSVIDSGFDTVSGSSNETLWTNNLSYTPAFYCISRNDGQESLYWGSKEVRMDSNELKWYGSDDSNLAWFIFNRPINVSYTAPDVDTNDDTQGSYSTNYGFKVSKTGEDVTTAGLDDLNCFSGASAANQPVRNQIVHKSGEIRVLNGDTESVAHGLGYRPMVHVWEEGSTGIWTPRVLTYEVVGPPISVNFIRRVYSDDTNIYIYNLTGGDHDYAYLILKDPHS